MGNRWGQLVATAVAAAVVGACSGSSASTDTAAPTTHAPAPTLAPTTSTTSTTVPPTTTTEPAPPDGLTRGMRGPQVLALEERLFALHYDVGGLPDDNFTADTGHAVMAFQKVHGLARTSRATQDVLDALPTAVDPAELVPGGTIGGMKVEVDIPRQVLFLYKNGLLDRIVAVSTGTGKRYCAEGGCGVAVTPGGSYKITRRIPGWRVSRLGRLYNPLYFNGGIAIHGAPSVPGHPASHGCVRIPMGTAPWFYREVPNGTPVYVVGGRRPAVPFSEEPTTTTTEPTTTTAPPPTTTTTAPPSTTTTTVPRPRVP